MSSQASTTEPTLDQPLTLGSSEDSASPFEVIDLLAATTDASGGLDLLGILAALNIQPLTYSPASDIASGTSPRQLAWGRTGNDVIYPYQPLQGRFGLGDSDLAILVGDFEFPELEALDPLAGRKWADTFVLGDWRAPFYAQGNPLLLGANDLSLLADFEPGRDRIQLHGSPSDYSTFDLFGFGTLLLYNREILPGIKLPDAIALVLAPNLNLNSSDFLYVGSMPAAPTSLELVLQIGSEGFEITDSICVDGKGNLYVAGTTSGDLISANAGLRDVWLRKYTADRELSFSVQFGSSASDGVFDITADDDGNIYLVGNSFGDLGGDVEGIIVNAWVAKLDAKGNRQWLQKIRNPAGLEAGNPATGYGVEIGKDGRIFVAGVVNCPLPPGSPFPLSTDNFLATYSPDGEQLSYSQVGNPSADDFDESYGFALAPDGSSYRGGFTTSAVEGKDKLKGLYDGLIVKSTPAGFTEWTRQIGTSDYDWIWDVDTDRAGNVIAAGWTLGSFAEGSGSLGSYDAFLAKLSKTGDLLWLRQFGSSGDEAAFNLEVDDADNIYVTGYTNGQLGPSLPYGNYDAWLAKFSADGTELYRQQLGATGVDQAYDIAIDKKGQSLFLAGITDSSLGTPNKGMYDAWVSRLDPLSGEILPFQGNDVQSVAAIDTAVIFLPATHSLAYNVELSQTDGARALSAIGVDNSSIDMGGKEAFVDNSVSISATVNSTGARAEAVGLEKSQLLLRPGDDVLTITADISGSGSGPSIAVREGTVSGNRGDDTITLKGEFWGVRAVVFGGDGNDRITCFGIGRDSFIQAGAGDDWVSLGRLETTPGAAPLVGPKAERPGSSYRGGSGFDTLILRETTEAEFQAAATPIAGPAPGWSFNGAQFLEFEAILFGQPPLS